MFLGNDKIRALVLPVTRLNKEHFIMKHNLIKFSITEVASLQIWVAIPLIKHKGSLSKEPIRRFNIYSQDMKRIAYR
jgi:hypothetical protein